MNGLERDETMRLWKGLFYCYWMSDKPLIQEELAENISNMVHCFLLVDAAGEFVRGFFVTHAREWVGIDKFRMDKFMMLVRRFLRQTFTYALRKEWSAEVVEALCARPLEWCAGSLGLQLHVTDVYLEELAKVGGESLPAETVLACVKPFAAELAASREERLRAQIEERVFKHLMRQTDLGIAYEEMEEESEEEEGSDDENEKDGSGDEDADMLNGDESDDDEGEDEEEEEEQNGVLDPRAGRVDAVIPQLQTDLDGMSKILFDAASSKAVGATQRKTLYGLSKAFEKLKAGDYPLSAELSDEGDDDAEELPSIRNMAKERSEADLKEIAKSREEKKNYRQFLKEKRSAPSAKKQPADENEDASSPKDDAETAPVMKAKGKKKQKQKKKPTEKVETPSSPVKANQTSNGMEVSPPEEVRTPVTKVKSKKKKKKQSSGDETAEKEKSTEEVMTPSSESESAKKLP